MNVRGEHAWDASEEDLHDDDEIEPPPDSGIRQTGDSLRIGKWPMDLSARAHGERPANVSFDAPTTRYAGWPSALRSGVALLVVLAKFVVTTPRPRFLDVCRFPAIQFWCDLKRALKATEWRKVVVVSGFALTAILVCVSVFFIMRGQGKPAAVVTGETRAAPAAASDAPPIEIDDVAPPAPPSPVVVAPAAPPPPAPPPPVAAKPAAPKPAAPKPAAPKVTIASATPTPPASTPTAAAPAKPPATKPAKTVKAKTEDLKSFLN